MGLLDRLTGRRKGKPDSQQVVEEGELRYAEPEGELEESVAALRADAGQIGQVIEKLVKSSLFIPSFQDPDLIQVGKGFKPAVLEFEEGMFVPVFTSKERAGIVDDLGLEFASGIEASASWLIPGMPEGFGIYINPGWTTCLMLPPETVKQIRDSGLV